MRELIISAVASLVGAAIIVSVVILLSDWSYESRHEDSVSLGRNNEG